MFKTSVVSRLRTITITFCCALFSLTLHAQTQVGAPLPDNVPALLVAANEAYAAKNYETFRDAMIKIRELRPNNSNYMYQLVIAHALLDEKRMAYDMMVRMQQQGLSYDFSTVENANNIKGTEVFDYVNDMMKMAGEPMGEAELAFVLPDSVQIPEAIAWDESRQAFLIGTVADGRILAVSDKGEVKELLKANDKNGMWSVFDLLVDVPRNRLWVTSATSPKFLHFNEADNGRSALFEYNLETLEPVASYPVPADGNMHSLGNMVMNPAGDIFIVDRVLPIVYQKPAAEAQLRAVLASREMVSMRGIAMQPDGNLMYIADRELGILVVDVKGGQAGKLTVPETLNVGGIDGLYLWDNHLVMIQNGIQPQRVMRLALDPTGTKVVSVRPLAVAQPDFDFPSYGTLKGKTLYYFNHSQWVDQDDQVKPVKVLSTQVDGLGELEQPDMQEYLRQRGEALEAQQRQKAADRQKAAEQQHPDAQQPDEQQPEK